MGCTNIEETVERVELRIMSCQIMSEITQLMRKSKIGKLRAKNINYPQSRLPPPYSKIIGAVASVFETEHEEKQAFLIVTEHSALKKRYGFKSRSTKF